MDGRTILVTGSTDGIGRAAARILAERGYHVLIHGRNEAKGRAVRKEIGERTGSERLDLLIADLSVQQQVRRLAAEIRDGYDRLDALVNNAGVYMRERMITPDGLETTFAVNYIAPFLLTHELLPLLRRSAPARIVNVASIAHRSVRSVDWGNLQGEKRYDPYEAYALSKLGVVVFTYGLGRILDGSAVSANCLHPGVIDTKLLRAFSGYHQGAPPEHGAEVEVYLATSPGIDGIHGRYCEERRWAPSSPLSMDAAVRERFWRAGLDHAGLREWTNRIPARP
ncbi:MAG: SDR family oxidoreductase [Methanomicrobiales archaeon]|nr:SDR family oxidoreductase [Methanomicrobiales archaeon]